jgi:hypothetical protein
MMKFLRPHWYFLLLRARYSQQPLSKHPSLCCSFNIRDRVLHSHITTSKIWSIVLYVLIFTFSCRLDDNNCELNDSKNFPNLICSEFLHKRKFDMSMSFPNIINLTKFSEGPLANSVLYLYYMELKL